MARDGFGVKLFRVEFRCRRCEVLVRVDRREGREDMLPRGWKIRVIPNCGLTNYTSEEPNCGVCAVVNVPGTNVRVPYVEATVEDDPDPVVVSSIGESRRRLDL